MRTEEFKQLLQKGEGQYVEFKETLDNTLAREIVAFSNASGGRIFLGINDDNKITGVPVTNRLKSQVTDIANNCDPKVTLHMEEMKNILIIDVPEGTDKPYQCSKGFFLRLGPNSQKLTRNEILKFSIRENMVRFDEQVCPEFGFKDFDDDKFEYYLKLAGISGVLDKKDILRNLRVLTDKGMTNAGILFFAKDPYKYIFASKIRCVLFRGNERIDILDKKEVSKGIIGNIEFAITYLKEHVPVRFEIKGARRHEYPKFPEDAYREAIVNAVVHRDYYESGEVAVEKFTDLIVINNPGGLPASFPVNQFGKLSWPRNRLLADLLSKTFYMEKIGTGIKRIKNFCKENKNPVEIKPLETHFFVNMKAVELPVEEKKYGVKVRAKLNKTQRRMLELIAEHKTITQKELAQKLGISKRNIEINISTLKEIGMLIRIGSTRTGYWRVKNQTKNH